MKIATWNIERLKHIGDIEKIQEICNQIGADVLVVTESDKRLELSFSNRFDSITPKDTELAVYKESECRVSIFTNYECIHSHITYDEQTAKCIELKTEFGSLIVYGTIMGIYGNRHSSYDSDVDNQMEDIHRLSKDKYVCVCGDYNCSFGDNYYFTKSGRVKVLNAFSEKEIAILTENQPETIDHIAISQKFIEGAIVEVEEWNGDKSLSDHKGIAVTIKRQGA